MCSCHPVNGNLSAPNCHDVLRRPAMFSSPWRVFALGILALCGMALAPNVSAQGTPTPGQNVNMVSGFTWPYGDPFLERQNEPSLAVSTRNALHLLAGANDYRTVDLNLLESEPGEISACPAGTSTCPGTAEPWVGQYISTDGGARWQSTLLPGFPQDVSPQGLASPLHGFTTASDPVVRAGTNGLFYYAGIAFNRGTNNGVVFVARFMDLNNKENGTIVSDGFPIRYINTGVVAHGNSTQFLDKPWMAVDIPRAGRTCTLNVPQGGGTVTQTIPAGNVYVAYANISTVNGMTTSIIYFSRSLDCGQTWSTPIALSKGYALSQGVNVQVDPETGIVYVCWRTFDNGTTQRKDSIVAVASVNGGYSFTPGIPVVTLPPFNINTPNAPAFFDQGTTRVSFRSAAYPAMAVQDSGYPFIPGPLYFAWSQRGVAPNGAARIMMLAIPGNATISSSGITLPAPFPVDNNPITDDAGSSFEYGHQWGPSMTYIQGKLMLVYYDQRLDHTLGQDQPSVSNGFFVPNAQGNFYTESRQLEGELTTPNGSAAVFTPFISDADPPLTLRRHTVDLTVAESNGGLGVPTFTYARLSQYDIGLYLSEVESGLSPEFHQLKVNPPDLPMFEKGMVPFMGDYIDIVGQMFVPIANGGWAFNNPKVNRASAVHYAAWTSNQDVIPPLNGDWTQYFPITSGTSVYNPSVTPPACQPGTGFEGDRNQNVYQSRITQGLLVSSPQNSKPLSTTVQRAFVVLVQNSTKTPRNFQLSIANQPPAGFASFQQALPNQPRLPNPLPAPVITQTVTIAAHSGASATVFALSSNPVANILLNVNEVDQNGNVITGGLSSFLLLNADGTVPPLTNPDDAPQNSSITGVEIYDPGITGPGITGANANATSITDPGITGPGITGSTCGQPGITGPGITGPGITGTGCTSPGITGPGITGPGITGPGITGTAPASPGITGTNVPAPGITGSAVSDATYTVSNTGNTTASYNVALLGCETSPCSTTPLQLMSSQIYMTPGTDGQCNLIPVQQNIVLSNNAHPVFTPANQLSSPGITGTAVSDAAFSLEPGDTALITLRGYVDVPTMQQIVTQVTPAIIPQAIDTNSAATTPPVVTPFFISTSSLPNGTVGLAYGPNGNGVILQAVGGTQPYQSWSASGKVPPGLHVSFDPEGGVATISGVPTAAGTYTFTVQVTDSVTPTPNTASKQFTIAANSPNLVFVVQPSNTTAGQFINPAVQALAQDNSGAVMPGVSITLSLHGPGNFTAASVTTQATGATGTATFANLAIDTPSAGDTLLATAGKLTTTSNSFNVLPQAPTNAAALASPSGSSVMLTWTASASPNVTSYNVYQATSANGPFTLLGSTTTTSFTDNTAVPTCSNSYYYYVTAVAAGVESAPSNQTSLVGGGC